MLRSDQYHRAKALFQEAAALPPGVRSGALPQILRQLRLSREEFDLCPQRGSEIRFPGCRLRFSNDIELLAEEVSERFPCDADNFRRLIAAILAFDPANPGGAPRTAREALRAALRDPLLMEMILCPVMWYGSAEEHDMDYVQFAILFRSIFCEGFARPRGGIRTIIRALVKRFRGVGGKLRMKCGVRRLLIEYDGVAGVELDSGECLTADIVLSSAGYFETLQLCSDAHAPPPAAEVGQISFVESISVTEAPPASFGHDATMIFYNDAETFTYARPDGLADDRSGIICCPTNFEHHADPPEGAIRLTALANFQRWAGLDEGAYREAKRQWHQRLVSRALAHVPDFRPHVVFTDMFTPRTIRHYTGHINGAVYGAPRKVRDGRTRLRNLFIIGTDQGLLGIIGAMMSGITMANRHVLSTE
jgi:phytoene dehydrogenase-like protein